jgi:hypothetical protein
MVSITDFFGKQKTLNIHGRAIKATPFKRPILEVIWKKSLCSKFELPSNAVAFLISQKDLNFIQKTSWKRDTTPINGNI